MDVRRITRREDLEDYLAAFNARNYARQISYYAPDIAYKVGSLSFTDPQSIADFYADFHRHVDQSVRIGWFAMGADKAAATIHSRFVPFKDYSRNGLNFLVGEERRQVSFAFYHLVDGRIQRIRVARYAGPEEDFAA